MSRVCLYGSGSCELDGLLRGGIPFGHVTELVGEAGSGKFHVLSITFIYLKNIRNQGVFLEYHLDEARGPGNYITINGRVDFIAI